MRINMVGHNLEKSVKRKNSKAVDDLQELKSFNSRSLSVSLDKRNKKHTNK